MIGRCGVFSSTVPHSSQKTQLGCLFLCSEFFPFNSDGLAYELGGNVRIYIFSYYCL